MAAPESITRPAQLVERLTACKWEVAGAISQGLKKIRNERIAFVLQTARRSRGWDDHVKWRSRLQ